LQYPHPVWDVSLGRDAQWRVFAASCRDASLTGCRRRLFCFFSAERYIPAGMLFENSNCYRSFIFHHLAPKPNYLVPKLIFLAPKPNYLVPKLIFLVPKPNYLAPKLIFLVPKLNYLVPKLIFLVPKPNYLAPKFIFLVPKLNYLAPKFIFLVPKFGFLVSKNFFLRFLQKKLSP
jgi:hypothetical protein